MSIRDIAEPVSLNDGTAMPGYGFGCYAAHGEEIINAIRWAVRDGYRYIDSAAMYGNEAEVGEAIRTCGVQREDLFISSKIWPTRFDDPDASLAQSLRDLGIDALDCCLLHWPGTDRKQRLSAYEKLLRRREEGFVRRIGVSNFQIKHLEEIRSAFGSFPVLNQIELHPLYQERDLCAYCRENGIRLVAWGPLFRGKLMQHPAIVEIAAAHGKTPTCFPSYSHRTIWIGLMRWTAANISEMIRIHSRGSSNAARPSFTTVMKYRIMGRKEHFHDTAL